MDNKIGKNGLKPLPRFRAANGFVTTAGRSKLMAKIRAKDTKPEILLRKTLWAQGLRFRVHVKEYPGIPDILIKKYRLAVFVDGDFWHGFNWPQKKKKIKTNPGYWIPKIERNMEKDLQVNRDLAEMGFTVMRFWDHQVNKGLDKCTNQVRLFIEAFKQGAIPDPD